MKTLGQERVKSAMRNGVEPFRLDNGAILVQPNLFKYVVGLVPLFMENGRHC